MRLCAYQGNQGEAYGIVEGTEVFNLVGSIFSPASAKKGAEVGDISVVRLLPPMTSPRKLIGLGWNYLEHAAEQGASPPTHPLFFFKPPTTLIGHLDEIVLTSENKNVEYEPELAVVIGKSARWVEEDAALDYVLGYTIGNDVSDRYHWALDGRVSRSKGFDTFCPLGPWIETELDASRLRITASVNDQMLTDGSTSDMLFGIQHVIAFLSRVMTLEPGDVILTGTPPRVGPIKPGDVVSITIEGIGTLTNPVVSQ